MNGLYGTVRPATINPSDDAEIFYIYKPNRGTLNEKLENFKSLDSNILVSAKCEEKGGEIIPLDGMYNLRLPMDIFNKKGIYTIYIRPKEIKTEIEDVGPLLNFPDVQGVVFNIDNLENIFDLTGYRMDFMEGKQKTGESRLITSCGYCVKTTTVPSNGFYRSSYKFTDSSSNLLFCTITPSIANSFRPNYKPRMGASGTEVAIVNTKFNPVMLELELVDHDIETLSNAIEGTQIRDLDKGKIITFNDKDEIYSMHEYFTLKDKIGEPLYDVKVKKNELDEGGKDYKAIINE